MSETTRIKGGWQMHADLSLGLVWITNTEGQRVLSGDDGLGNFRGNLEALAHIDTRDAAELVRGFAKVLAAFTPGVTVGSPRIRERVVTVAFRSRENNTTTSTGDDSSA